MVIKYYVCFVLSKPMSDQVNFTSEISAILKLGPCYPNSEHMISSMEYCTNIDIVVQKRSQVIPNY